MRYSGSPLPGSLFDDLKNTTRPKSTDCRVNGNDITDLEFVRHRFIALCGPINTDSARPDKQAYTETFKRRVPSRDEAKAQFRATWDKVRAEYNQKAAAGRV